MTKFQLLGSVAALALALPAAAQDRIEMTSSNGAPFIVVLSVERLKYPALGRMGGNVVGFVANNSAVSSGQVDIDAAYKNARFIRFCNLYNIPVMFLEDTTGFLPGREQESGGIVQAGRAMLDAIVDLRTPRFLVIVRNAFGGAYAAWNSIPVGADFVVALPTTRVAVMGPAGVEYVYKDELRKIRGAVKDKIKAETEAQLAAGLGEQEAGESDGPPPCDWPRTAGTWPSLSYETARPPQRPRAAWSAVWRLRRWRPPTSTVTAWCLMRMRWPNSRPPSPRAASPPPDAVR